MVVTDPVSDMLTRIRNSALVYNEVVSMPTSKLRVALAGILEDEGYIEGYSLRGACPEEERAHPSGGQRVLEVKLKYVDNRKRVISGLKRVSKPGLRVYSKSKSLPRVMGGLGIAIISTSAGIMTDREARRRNIGGEVLCYVW